VRSSARRFTGEWRTILKYLSLSALAPFLFFVLPVGSSPAFSAIESIELPTGQLITPTGAPGSIFQALNPHVARFPEYTVGQAESAVVSPDGHTLLVLTSGYNLIEDARGKADPAASTEFIFVFDIANGNPSQLQAIPVPNAFAGIAWAPDGAAFYVAGGKDDDVHTYQRTDGVWSESGEPIALHHTAFGVAQPAGNGLYSIEKLGAAVGPLAAGVAATADGRRLVVANLENDSISVVELAHQTARGPADGSVVTELDLRPGRNDPTQSGQPGGEFPFWIAIRGNDTAYISSERDREIVVVSLVGRPAILKRIRIEGNPNKMVLDRAQERLFVTADNSDLLIVVDTRANEIAAQVRTTGPADLAKTAVKTGSSPNSVTLSPDERVAYVTNAGTNSVAVIDIARVQPAVLGLIPTGWYPTSVAASADGKWLYVVNAKSLSGPNPKYGQGGSKSGQYVLQLTKAGFLALPVPHREVLEDLTELVASNNGFGRSAGETGKHDVGLEQRRRDATTMSFLRQHIRHVIYIVKENRTYDQILGDLPVGNGDPSLTMYGQAITPNFHAIARGFVDLDNFYCSGEISMNGWQWSTAGRGLDLNEKVGPVNYAKRGGSYDSEGSSRHINVGLATARERVESNPIYGAQAANDPDLLPGTANEVAADGPDGEEGKGYIWDAVLRAGKTLRNYGFFEDLQRYGLPQERGGIAPLVDPASTHTQVAFPADPALMKLTDLYFAGFDNRLPDFYRYREWVREFDIQVKTLQFPAFEMVRLMHDHTGDFGTAIDGVNTPELQQADNDYAVGLLIEKIAHSPYRSNTLIFIIEDDSQDGPDHIDAHRSTAYVVGPYVKRAKVVSTHYATTNMLRTIEDVLGVEHLSVHDAGVRPMADVFDTTQGRTWTYQATPSRFLMGTKLPLQRPSGDTGAIPRPLHDAAWWAQKSRQFTFVKEDMNDASAYNLVLWQGTMGDQPYPALRSGTDLRRNRGQLLGSFQGGGERRAPH
jgi:DNA-binding beta-propeller fold protein YncE